MLWKERKGPQSSMTTSSSTSLERTWAAVCWLVGELRGAWQNVTGHSVLGRGDKGQSLGRKVPMHLGKPRKVSREWGQAQIRGDLAQNLDAMLFKQEHA